MKKLTALLLAVFILAGMLSVFAFADEADNGNTIDEAQIEEIVQALYDGNYDLAIACIQAMKTAAAGEIPDGYVGMYNETELVASGNSVIIEKVSLGFSEGFTNEQLNDWAAGNYYKRLIIDEGQLLAAVTFKITNNTKSDIIVSDIHDEFLIELNYDNGFVYSTDSEADCLIASGSDIYVMHKMSGSGSSKISVAPLSSKEVTVYFVCPAQLMTSVDKSLKVSFSSRYDGWETFTFVFR